MADPSWLVHFSIFQLIVLVLMFPAWYSRLWITYQYNNVEKAASKLLINM